jgi:hypothetical protein
MGDIFDQVAQKQGHGDIFDRVSAQPPTPQPRAFVPPAPGETPAASAYF